MKRILAIAGLATTCVASPAAPQETTTTDREAEARSCTFNVDYVFFIPKPGVRAEVISWRNDESLAVGDFAISGFIDRHPFAAIASACDQFNLSFVLNANARPQEDRALVQRLVAAFDLAGVMELTDPRLETLQKEGSVGETVGNVHQGYGREQSLSSVLLTYYYWIHN